MKQEGPVAVMTKGGEGVEVSAGERCGVDINQFWYILSHSWVCIVG